MRQGNEPVSHIIWNSRIAKLVAFLKGTPRTAEDLIKSLVKTKKWQASYATNVLAASDMAGAVNYRNSDKKWYVEKTPQEKL